jgi:hypothetical protein
MPIKSKAQRRKFAELLLKGKISPEVFERWNREAGGAELPERVRPKAGTKARPKAKPRRSLSRGRRTSRGRRPARKHR